MRYGVFSDVHANLEALDAVLEAYKDERIDKYVCVGDIVGYGANPAECLEKIRNLTDIIVAGNHDWGCVEKTDINYFNTTARDAVLWTKGVISKENREFLKKLNIIYENKDFVLVHGSLNEPENFNYIENVHIAYNTMGLLNRTICFVGHSHMPVTIIGDKSIKAGQSADDKNIVTTPFSLDVKFDKIINIIPDKKYIINVGSVGQPRDDNSESCYCIYDAKEQTVEIKRAVYDIKTAQDKIRDVGLPEILASRLALGR